MQGVLRASTWPLLAVLVAAAGCSGSSHGNLAPPAAVSPESNVVSVAGLSPSDLEASIGAAKAAGKSVRYVSVQTPTGVDDYSVYAQVVRSQNALLVRSYGRIQAYALSTAKVLYSAIPNEPVDIATLPLVTTPSIDAAFTRNTPIGIDSATRARLCSNCTALLIRPSGMPIQTDLWPTAKDPWQLNVDYVFWKPGSDAAIANANKRSAMFFNPVNTSTGGCPPSVQSCYYPGGGNTTIAPPSNGGGGGNGGKVPLTCQNLSQGAGTAMNAALAAFPQVAGTYAAGTGPEAGGFIYKDASGNLSYDAPTLDTTGDQWNGSPSPPAGSTTAGWYHTHPTTIGADPTGIQDTGSHFSAADETVASQIGAPVFVTVNVTNAIGNTTEMSYEHVNGTKSGTETSLGATASVHC